MTATQIDTLKRHADSPTADANEFFLTKDYTSAEETNNTGGFSYSDASTISEGDDTFEDAAGVNGCT